MDIFTKLKDYIDLRIEDARLKLADGFASAVSAILKIKIAILFLFLSITFGAVALEQWLSDLIGRPWGALIVGGVMLIAFAIVVLMRRRILGNTIDSIFSATFGFDTDDIKAERKKVETELKFTENSISDDYSKARNFVTGITTAISIFKALRKKSDADKADNS